MLWLDVKDSKKILCVKNAARNIDLQIDLVLCDRDRDALEKGGKMVAVKLSPDRLGGFYPL